MTDTFLAGQKLRASTINNALPLMAIAGSDKSVTSSTTLAAVTGLSVPLAANTTYVWDGYFGYTAAEAGDLKVAFTAPSGATGSWSLHQLVSTSTGGTGDLDARRETTYGTSTTQVAGGSDSGSGQMACLPHGHVVTSSSTGNLTVYVAQNTSSATATVLSGGAWLRVQRVESST